MSKFFSGELDNFDQYEYAYGEASKSLTQEQVQYNRIRLSQGIFASMQRHHREAYGPASSSGYNFTDNYYRGEEPDIEEVYNSNCGKIIPESVRSTKAHGTPKYQRRVISPDITYYGGQTSRKVPREESETEAMDSNPEAAGPSTPTERINQQVEASANLLKSWPSSNVTSGQGIEQPEPAAEPLQCIVGILFKVRCEEDYLGASKGFLRWGEIARDHTAKSKLEEYLYIVPNNEHLICKHHLVELGFTEEPHSQRGQMGTASPDIITCAELVNLSVLAPYLNHEDAFILDAEMYFNLLRNNKYGLLPGKRVCIGCVTLAIKDVETRRAREQRELLQNQEFETAGTAASMPTANIPKAPAPLLVPLIPGEGKAPAVEMRKSARNRNSKSNDDAVLTSSAIKTNSTSTISKCPEQEMTPEVIISDGLKEKSEEIPLPVYIKKTVPPATASTAAPTATESTMKTAQPKPQRFQRFNQILRILNLSPLDSRDLSDSDLGTQARMKIASVIQSSVQLLERDGVDFQGKRFPHENADTVRKISREYLQMFENLKRKYENSPSVEGKIEALALIPDFWTAKKIKKYFAPEGSTDDDAVQMSQIRAAKELRLRLQNPMDDDDDEVQYLGVGEVHGGVAIPALPKLPREIRRNNSINNTSASRSDPESRQP